MAFNAEFMTFQKRVNSTAVPGQGTVYSITLKERTSIFNPTIILKYNGNPTSWNYCRISEFSRYYWITSWIWDSGLWYATCTIDVLATYHSEIGNANLYVLRSASEYDGNVVDTFYPIKSEVYNTCSLAASPFASNIHGNVGMYMLGVLNPDTSAVGATSYYLVDDTSFRQLCQYLYSLSYTNVTDITTNMQKLVFNPLQYVVSCMWLPFAATSGGTDEIDIGYWQTPITAYRCNSTLWYTGDLTISIPRHPQAQSRGRYLNLSPYSQYTLEFWPWGSMPIDSTKIVNASYLKCSYIVDYITGVGNLRVTALDNNQHSLGDGEVLTAVAQVGVPIQLAQTSVNLSNLTNASTVVAAAGASVVEAFKTSEFDLLSLSASANTDRLHAIADDYIKGERGSSTSKTNSIGSALAAAATEIRTSGSNGGLAVLRLGVRVNAKFMYVTTENVAFAGRPLCAFRTLNTLTGFCQVADGDIELAATAQEAQAVKAFLEHGIYLDGYSNNASIIDNGEIIIDDGGGSGGSGNNGNGDDNGEIIIDDGGGSGGSGNNDNGEIIIEG